ncbi:ChbG/HpnK family deacetylase [Fluviicola sp.]|jgi:predicted glycoside hydrolase/deacetylase ChbG (UPF0249 family)|uniref:ChbG/HpnK family deacetylase n=1 Tax=Fluviicola sp. TaxID=1917219 RepID=UPI002818D1AD|nr:ChbG/HpnK family deacetylase [Fluviicola sp.]MDR0801377.1 ChbG/HpnK family deacetylase [Fluviicola sp.]
MRISKYILTADDYGAIDYIDQGIIKAIRMGKINSVACFAVRFDRNGETELSERIQKLLDLKKEGYKFSIGLHFCITAGFSSDIDTILYGNSLTKQNKPKKRYDFKSAVNYRFNQVWPDHLEKELRSQIKTLQDLLGDEKIDSISNHHGLVYINTNLFRPYARVAAEYGIPVRSPLTWRKAKLEVKNWDRKVFNLTIREGVKLKMLDQLRNALDSKSRIKVAQNLNLIYPTCLVDEFYGQPFKPNLELLFQTFEEATFSAEFMFHLADAEYRLQHGFNEDQSDQIRTYSGIDSSYFKWREMEFNTLMNTDISTKPLRTVFRGLVEIDREKPVWMIKAGK